MDFGYLIRPHSPLLYVSFSQPNIGFILWTRPILGYVKDLSHKSLIDAHGISPYVSTCTI